MGYRWIHQCFLLVSVLCLHLWSIWCLFFCMVWGINLTILKFIPAPAILNNFYPMINFCMYLGILNFVFYFTDLNFYAPVPHYFIIDYLSYWKPFFIESYCSPSPHQPIAVPFQCLLAMIMGFFIYILVSTWLPPGKKPGGMFVGIIHV